MNRYGLILVAMVCIASLAVQGRRWAAASRAAESAVERLVEVSHDAAEVQRLRAMQEGSAFGPPPVQDLIERVGEELQAVGLPVRTLASLTNEADRPAGRGQEQGLRRRDARLTLEPIEPAELGAFLGRWRAAHPLWTVSDVELSRQQARGQERGGYSAKLVLSALYVDPGTERP